MSYPAEAFPRAHAYQLVHGALPSKPSDHCWTPACAAAVVIIVNPTPTTASVLSRTSRDGSLSTRVSVLAREFLSERPLAVHALT